MFPEMSLEPKEYLLVYASNRNRTNPTGQLHTNFVLDADGEYLALVANNGRRIVHEYAPEYVGQFSDVSYGLSQKTEILLQEDANAVYHVPDIADNNSGWNQPDYEDTGWIVGKFPFSFSDGAGTNVRSRMLNINSSLLIRSEFLLVSRPELQI
jgi:hypothetical protein